MAGLDLHHHGDHHRAALRAPLEEAPQLVPHALARQLRCRAAPRRGARPSRRRAGARPPRPARPPRRRPRSRGSRSRAADSRCAGLAVDDDDRDHDALRGEVPAVADHDVLDLGGATAVEEHAARRARAPRGAPRRPRGEHVAVLGDAARGRRGARRRRRAARAGRACGTRRGSGRGSAGGPGGAARRGRPGCRGPRRGPARCRGGPRRSRGGTGC